MELLPLSIIMRTKTNLYVERKAGETERAQEM